MSKPIVLHLGEPVRYNTDFYNKEFASRFQIVRNDCNDRESFKEALRTKKFGDFKAIFRPFWNSGGEMGMWDKELISLLPASVEIFASAGAGFNWADVDEFARHGIYYCNGATCSDDAVTDLMIWHLISVCRNTTWSQEAAKSCDENIFMDAHNNVPPVSHNVSSFTIGIVGLGSIGRLACKKLHAAFGSKVHYYDIVRADPEFERATESVFHSDLHDLLKSVDVVIVSVPYNKFTHNIIGEKEFAAMRKGSYIINTSRGQTVDEKPLIAALQSGKLAGAGLDVFYTEPKINPVLAKMRNVAMTSHNAGGAVDTWVNFELHAMRNILAYLTSGKTITPPVNKKLYDSIKSKL